MCLQFHHAGIIAAPLGRVSFHAISSQEQNVSELWRRTTVISPQQHLHVHSTRSTPSSPYPPCSTTACDLCASLAAHVAERSAASCACALGRTFRAQPKLLTLLGPEAVSAPADRLRVLHGARLHEGEAAWLYLLERDRDLRGLNWLAAKVGLTRQAAQALGSSAALLRRLCRRCGHR